MDLMEKLRSFLGFQQIPPRNEFRNPIWGSDDDDDDGDELFSQQSMENFSDPLVMHQELAKQMHDIFKSFGSMFGDMRQFLNDDSFQSFSNFQEIPGEMDSKPNASNIRDYYLKPGYHIGNQTKEDINLDGKISSEEISGLLKQEKDNGMTLVPATPFNGNLVPGRTFCKTVITTSIRNPDGTVETKRIVKNGNEVIEETTITNGSGSISPVNQGVDSYTEMIPQRIILDFASLFNDLNIYLKS